MNLTRRQFLQASAASSLVLPRFAVRAADPYGRFKTALVGCGWWGMNILSEAIASKRANVVGVCDVDRGHLDAAAAKVEELTGGKPVRYTDYRDLLKEQRPEVVIIATPDHWHPLQTIDAVRAGAHVYVEKPVGHTIGEGRVMVRAARKYGRVVQVGTHRRVSPHNLSAMEFLRSGKVGKVGLVRAFVLYGGARGPERATPNQEPPPTLDWDKWCGPGPLRPFNPRIHPRGFRSFLDYANGTLGDWGIHWMDQILWWSEEKWPKRVYSTGGRPISGPVVYLPDVQTTDAPDVQTATFEFDAFTAIWEHRNFAGNNAEKGEEVGVYFHGTEGTLHVGWRTGWKFYPANKSQPVIEEKPSLNEPDQQNIRELWADFMRAIETGTLPACDIEIGHRSTNMSLLGMLSYKLGRSVQWDGAREVIINDSFANTLLRRDYRLGYKYPEPELV
jgi:predicted dehydrogenase